MTKRAGSSPEDFAWPKEVSKQLETLLGADRMTKENTEKHYARCSSPVSKADMANMATGYTGMIKSVFFNSCVLVLIDRPDTFYTAKFLPSSKSGNGKTGSASAGSSSSTTASFPEIHETVQLPDIPQIRDLDNPANLFYAIFTNDETTPSGYAFVGFFPCTGPVFELYRYTLCSSYSGEGDEVPGRPMYWTGRVAGEVGKAAVAKSVEKTFYSFRIEKGFFFFTDRRPGSGRVNVPVDDLIGIGEVRRFLDDEFETWWDRMMLLDETKATYNECWRKITWYMLGFPYRWGKFIALRLPPDLRKDYLAGVKQLRLIDSYRLAACPGESSSGEKDEIPVRIPGITNEYARIPTFIPVSIPYFPESYSHEAVFKMRDESLTRDDETGRIRIDYKKLPNFGTGSDWTPFYNLSEIDSRVKKMWSLSYWFRQYEENGFKSEWRNGDSVDRSNVYRIFSESQDTFQFFYKFFRHVPESGDEDETVMSDRAEDEPITGGQSNRLYKKAMTDNQRARFLNRKRDVHLGVYWNTPETRSVAHFDPDGNLIDRNKIPPAFLATDAFHSDFVLDFLSYTISLYLCPAERRDMHERCIRELLKYRIEDQSFEYVRHFSPEQKNSPGDKYALYTGLLVRFRVHQLYLNNLMEDYMTYHPLYDEEVAVAGNLPPFCSGDDPNVHDPIVGVASGTTPLADYFSRNMLQVYNSLPEGIAPVREFVRVLSEFYPNTMGIGRRSINDYRGQSTHRPPVEEGRLRTVQMPFSEFVCFAIPDFVGGAMIDYVRALENSEKMCYDMAEMKTSGKKGVIESCPESRREITAFHFLISEIAKGLPVSG